LQPAKCAKTPYLQQGKAKSFFHQWHKLTKQGYQHPNPRRQILDNLKAIILQAIREGTDVCVAMDSNEALDTKNQHFQEWIAECGLISVHKSMYNKEYYKANKIPTTHQNSTSKIDHMLCTPAYSGAPLELQSNHYMMASSPTIGHW
jgi:hypothetical protein